MRWLQAYVSLKTLKLQVLQQWIFDKEATLAGGFKGVEAKGVFEVFMQALQIGLVT